LLFLAPFLTPLQEKRDLEAELDEVSKASEELEKLQRAATERAEYADMV
jgi:chaperonin cofactor prefoldin